MIHSWTLGPINPLWLIWVMCNVLSRVQLISLLSILDQGFYYKVLRKNCSMKYHTRLTGPFKEFFPRPLARHFYHSSHPLIVFYLEIETKSNFILFGLPFSMTRRNLQDNTTPSTPSHEVLGGAKVSQPEQGVWRCCQQQNIKMLSLYGLLRLIF